MAGSVFQVGEQKIRPGVYVRVTNIGEPAVAVVPQGIVAALLRASWGPLGQVVTLENADAITATYGSGGTLDVAAEAFRGGCRRVLAYRLGTGGTKATLTLKDTAATPADVVTLTAKYEGIRGNDFKITIRDSLTDATKRELLVYEGTTLRQTITFAKGTGEPQALVDAVTASNSPWITATKLADGNGTLAAINQQALAGGTDPTVTGTDYSAGLSAIEAIDWNVLAVDTEDPATHTTVQTYIDRVRNEGKRVLAVVGEPTSVALTTRLANAAAFNDPPIIYVANGFKGSDGVAREGYKAAARVAGMVAAAQITDSLTHAVVRNATELVGALTNAEIEQAIQSGALVFTMSAQKQVQIEYGINTFVTPTADMDAGWKKIRRVRTRDNLMDRIAATWDPLIGKINNSPDGRATLIASAQGIINTMIAEGALLAGTIYEDPNNPPAGDSAWFVAQVDDLDSAEKVYATFAFRFAPPSEQQ
ncbi:Tail sheath protein [Moorella glycerini]|uniref:Phage tail sheath protein n=1 Tax=Neomoorella stamsii TaxID=1266720 RepID=A0A9X7J0F6_9FIRM|nr:MULTISPECIES: phage tail sheath subtilisin-like domain-containing protein [Moorella]PRR69593.1 Phage tail sheath protein [Moorella stamsii]CEP67883.1 Tail sheath protein [Moorella glycerini]CEP68753.1 Tail sheath protein [Moorella glycerini]